MEVEDYCFFGLILQIHANVSPWHCWAAVSWTGRGQHILTGQEMLFWAGNCKIELHKAAIEGLRFSVLLEKSDCFLWGSYSDRGWSSFFFFFKLKIRKKKPIRYCLCENCELAACGVLHSLGSLCQAVFLSLPFLQIVTNQAWRRRQKAPFLSLENPVIKSLDGHNAVTWVWFNASRCRVRSAECTQPRGENSALEIWHQAQRSEKWCLAVWHPSAVQPSRGSPCSTPLQAIIAGELK